MRQSLAKLSKPNVHLRQAMTLLEVMIMILVLSITLTAMFTTLIQGMNLQRLVQQRVQATNIAREGIEGVVNLRNTNWLRFTSNRINCWNVSDYDATCITASSGNMPTTLSGSNILERKNGAWYLSGATAFDENDWGVSMDRFRIYVDTDGWYSSSGTTNDLCNSFQRTDCKSIFSREMIVTPVTGQEDTALEVTAKVRWRDANPHTVTLTEIIHNWKSNYDR